MKRTTIFTLALLLSVSFSTEASAQAFLKGLADKAKDKVKSKIEHKVDRTVDSAMDNVLDGKKGPSNKSNAKANTKVQAKPEKPVMSNEHEAQQWEGQGEYEWTAGTFFSMDKYNGTGEYDDSGNAILKMQKSTYNFNDGVEVLKALPAIATPKQILCQDETTPERDALLNYHVGYSNYYGYRMRVSEERAMAMAVSMQKSSARAANQPRVSGQTINFMDKVMEAIMNSGLDMETASEEDMQKVVLKFMNKEYGIPEAEMAKMMAMGEKDPDAATAYLKKNFPGVAKKMSGIIEDSAAMQNIGELSPEEEKVLEICEEMIALNDDPSLLEEMTMVRHIDMDLEKYAAELLSLWPKSEECAKVNAMEKELQAKTDAWIVTNNTNYNDEAPDFWVAGRKAQNAVINEFNEKIVAMWCEKIQGYIDHYMPLALRVADIDKRYNEAAAKVGDSADLKTYLTMQTAISSTIISAFQFVNRLPAQAMDAPRIYSVLEQWMP